MSGFGFKSYIKNNLDYKNKVKYNTLQVQKINKKLKMHSKAVLVDNKYLFI
jgi:phosphatidylserine/phosphatidylglycerophosphate/cardiolipin synthase-like enzyme